MKRDNSNPEDARLGSLLREARSAPVLPPRFQENVWRRIADAEAAKTSGLSSWFEAVVAYCLRPRLALGAVAVLMVVGAAVGGWAGNQLARHNAQARYLAAVAPNSLR